MPKFLDVRRVVDALVADRHGRLEELGVIVDVEDGLHCPASVHEGTVSEVFGAVLDHFLSESTNPGKRVRIGWLPASNGSRVFFLTNASDNGSQPGAVSPESEDTPNGAILEASRRIERDGGRLWAEGGVAGNRTFFILFGPPDS